MYSTITRTTTAIASDHIETKTRAAIRLLSSLFNNPRPQPQCHLERNNSVAIEQRRKRRSFTPTWDEAGGGGAAARI